MLDFLTGLSGGQAAVATLACRLVSYWLLLPAGLVAWLIFRPSAGTPSLSPTP